jgi:hypothetical protein
MTTISHIMQPFVVTHWLLRRYTYWSTSAINWVSGFAGLLGGIPDILSFPETIRGNWNGLYRIFHDFSFWSFVPTIGLHQIEDWLAHDQVNGGWFLWVYFAEPIVAFAIVAYIWYESGVKWMWAGIGAFGLTWLVGLIAELL